MQKLEERFNKINEQVVMEDQFKKQVEKIMDGSHKKQNKKLRAIE